MAIQTVGLLSPGDRPIEHGDRFTSAAVDGQETGVAEGAYLERDLVTGRCDAGELDPATVLIRPEVRGFGRRAIMPSTGEQRGDCDGGAL